MQKNGPGKMRLLVGENPSPTKPNKAKATRRKAKPKKTLTEKSGPVVEDDYLESVFKDNLQGFWYPDLEYQLYPRGRVYRYDTDFSSIPRECSKLFPPMSFPGNQHAWRVNGGLSTLKSPGKTVTKKYEMKSPIKLGIADELFRVENFPLSYLVCGQLSGKNWSEMIKDFSTCSDRNCCSEIARNITNAMIRSFSSKIFSNKTQPFYELMANSVDAMGQNASVGKFGIGFFSALGLITEEPMKILSFTDDQAIKATIKYVGDQYVIDLVCYRSDHAKSGTVISVPSKGHVFTGREVLLPKNLIEIKYGKLFSIHDMGRGISPDVFFTKLLLPTISTKKETTYSENSFKKERNKMGFSVRVNGYQIWYTYNGPNVYLNFSNKYGVPISRDDIIFEEKDLQEVLTFMKSAESQLTVLEISEFEKRIEDMIRWTNNPFTKKIFSACLRDSYRRNNIRTIIPFLTDEQREAHKICSGNCLDIQATEEVLKRIYPHTVQGNMCLIKAQVPTPSSYDLASILFYSDEKSLETVNLELKSYAKQYPLINESVASPELKRLRDIFYYVVFVKAKYVFPVHQFNEFVLNLEGSVHFKNEIYSLLGSLIFRYQGRITSVREAPLPVHLSKSEVFEALTFMYRYSKNRDHIFLPFFSNEPGWKKFDLEEVMRLGPGFLDKSSIYLDYWNSMNLRNYPAFHYGLFYPIEFPTITQIPDNRIVIPTLKGQSHSFSLTEQIQAALSYDRSITTVNDFLDFMEFLKAKKYHKAQVQNIKLAVNFGTPREYSESVLYELLQNSKDAGASSISITTNENFLQIKDNAGGITPAAYLGLSIPFYSSKKASDRGQIGSGFFNIYKRAEEVRINSISKEWFLNIVDIPQRDSDGIISDIKRTVVVVPRIGGDGHQVGTAVTIKTNLNKLELYYLSRVKKTFNDALKFEKTETLAENDDMEIYLSPEWEQSPNVLMLDGIPHSILKSDQVGKYITVNLKKGTFEISQSRTVHIGYYSLHNEDNCFSQMTELIKYDFRKNIRTIITNKNPFFYVKELERDKILASLDNYKTLTPYGLKRLKDMMSNFFVKNMISFDDITKTVKVSSKVVATENREAESIIVAFCEAWSHLAIDKKIVSKNLKAVKFKDIVALGLYYPKTQSIAIQKEVYSGIFGLKQKILAKSYLEIIRDPGWDHLFGIDSLQAPTVIHELEHYRDDSGHGDSNHEPLLNPRINYEYVLEGLHTFDSRALLVARYLFCNGLYDLLKEILKNGPKVLEKSPTKNRFK